MRTFYKPKSNKIILDIILRYNLPMTSLTISLNTVIKLNSELNGTGRRRTVQDSKVYPRSLSFEIPPRLHTTKY